MVAAFGIESRNMPSQQPNGAEASCQHQPTHPGGSPQAPLRCLISYFSPDHLVRRVVSALEIA